MTDLEKTLRAGARLAKLAQSLIWLEVSDIGIVVRGRARKNAGQMLLSQQAIVSWDGLENGKLNLLEEYIRNVDASLIKAGGAEAA